MKKNLLLAVLLLVALSTGLSAVEVKFSGYNWLRYTAGYTGADYTSSRTAIERNYLKWDMSVDDKISGMLILDIVNVDDAQENIDFGIWVKVLTVDYKVFDGLTARAGMQVLAFGMNDVWSYPLIGYSMDVRKGLVKVCDIGLGLYGKIEEINMDYQLYAVNGTGYKSIETNKGKAGGVSAGIRPFSGLYARVSVYADQPSDSRVTDINGSAFVRYTEGPVDCFVQYIIADREASAGKSGTAEGYSFFAGYKITDSFSANLRFDTWNPDTGAVDDTVNTYFAGVNYIVNANLLVQLNYELEMLSELNGAKQDNKYMLQTKFSF
ncbi:MAG: hypothetical protein JXR81_09665 [Candidatus Goldbacteria bacterium]|nr:hypothetical protein [Candidatus Goldiibacteriota bacterium]